MSAPLRALLVEESTDRTELIGIELSRAGFDVITHRVMTEEALLGALAREPWHTVLVGHSVPGFSAAAALEAVERSGVDVPVIIIASYATEEQAAELVRLGAGDYVLEDNLARLGPSIRRELRAAETRRARAAAENMAHKLATLVTCSLDAIVSETLDGLITSWNPAAERLYGWSEQEALGRSMTLVTPDDLQNEGRAARERIARGESVVHLDTRRRRRDGRLIDVAISYSPVRDKDGALVGISKIVRDISEREAQHRAIAESIPHLVWITSPDGKHQYFNGRWAEYTGVTIDDLMSGTRADVLHPDDLAGMLERWHASLREGHPFETQYRLRRADGAYRWHIARATPVRDANGAIWRWFGTATDIHEQRMLEEAMARDALVLSQVKDSVIVTDLDGVVTYWNEGATRLYGWTAEEMVGAPVLSRLPERERPPLREALAAVAQGRERSGRMRDFKKDGSPIWIDARFSRMHGRSGEVLGVLCLSNDVTDRRAAEEALHLRDRAIQAVTQGIIITDPCQLDNPVIFASPGFERLTGYRAADVIGRNCRMLQGPDTDPEALARVRLAIQEERPVTEVLLNVRKDGSTFWNELSISPVRDQEGRLTHFVGVQADVTARRELETQYRQAQKMEAIGQLAGGVAHDFNNLICIINGYSDLMLQELPEDHPSYEMLQLIRKAGDRSSALTRQLLAFSRQQVITPRALDLNASVTNLEKMLRRIIGEDVSLSLALDPALGTVRIDPGQIEQVIMNLAVNARDAMPRGGTLTIETRNVQLAEGAAPGSYVALAVRDTGCGMSAETRARIFEPFFTTKSVGKGTGLGLAVVHSIVEQNRGVIGVDSQPGAGTTFQVLLPRVDEQPEKRAVRQLAATFPRGTETLLLVEDDDVVRALSRHVLTGCGYTVLEAVDGESALKIADQHGQPIETLVTDVVMPGISGRELADRLCVLYPKLRVLYVSGYPDDAIVRHGIQHDKIPFLQKPFSPLALARRVRELLDA